MNLWSQPEVPASVKTRADVFILKSPGGPGLAMMLPRERMSHPALQRWQRRALATKDVQGLSKQFGFLEIVRPELYQPKES